MRRYADRVDRIRRDVLESPGETSNGLRKAVAARAADLGGRAMAIAPGEREAIPEDLREYVDTVALHAYRVTDEEITHLRRSGYSEDQIFEVSVAASVGAALSRLEIGLAALEAEENA